MLGMLAMQAGALEAELSAQTIEPVAQPLETSLRRGPLLPDAVLKSSSLRFPAILESFQREAAARSDQLSADGAFDLLLEAEYYDRFTGTFSGGYAEVKATQPIAPYGAKVFGSYRVSDGRFPIYENIFNTNQLGEFKIGALFSLLRDRDIDSRRFAVEDTRLAASQAQLDILLVQLKVQHEALRAYWTWVAAGREIRVYEELLEIAQARAIGLRREVEAGAKARIALTENEQNVIRRQTLLEQARRDFLTAANNLSYYLRDTNGQRVVPTRDQVPSTAALTSLPDLQSLIATRRNDILDTRPELQDLKIALQRARNKIELRENDLQPRLDASVELSRDFGAVGDGGSTFDSTDTVVGVTLTVPLQRRDARGRLRRAESELRELELRQQRISDQIQVEIDNILTSLSAALRLSSLANREVEIAGAMVNAERKRFRLGAGDFFLVNLREESAADAQVRAIRAELSGRLAAASFNAATMNLRELGLE
jgi:outer membrane protein TolC